MYHHAHNDTQPNESHQKITIYNTQTHQIEHTAHWDWNHTYINSLHFSQLNDTIAISESRSGDVKIYNYKTKQLSSITVKEAEKEYHSHYGGINYNDMTPIISLHPMQPLISIAWQNIYIHNLETSIRTAIPCGHVQHCFCEYSPDGSFIVKHTPHSHMSIIRPNQNAPLTIISEQNEDSYFKIMAIHPNNKVLMTLSRKNGEFGHHSLKYWDINNTSKPIAIIAPLNNQSYVYSSPSFSPSGKKLLIILNNTCYEFKVPFKVMYKDITKKQLLYRLFVLKNYMDTLEIPEDIQNLLTYTFHEICKR
jgi:WD40 repeat protein